MSVIVMEPMVIRARAPRRATSSVIEMDPMVVTARAPLTNRAAGALRDAAPDRAAFGGFAYSRTAQDDAEVASAVARAARRPAPAPTPEPAPEPIPGAPPEPVSRVAFGGFAYERTAEDDADVTRAAAAEAARSASASGTTTSPTAPTASDPATAEPAAADSTTDTAGTVDAAALAPTAAAPAATTASAEPTSTGVSGPSPSSIDSPATLVAAVATAAGGLPHPEVTRAPLDRAFAPLTTAASARASRPMPRGGGGRYPPPRPVEPIEIDPVPTATEALQTKLNERLPELTLPTITPMPDRTVPTLPPVNQVTPDELAVEIDLDDMARDTASVDSREAARRAAATRPPPDAATPAPAPRPLSPPVLIDFRTQPQPIPPAQAELETGQIARALAIVMANVDTRARGLVDRARDQAFPPNKLANYFLDLTDPMVEPIATGLRAKMNELAGAAHVSADALSAAVASRRAELDAHATHVATDAELEVSRTVVTLTREQEREQARIEARRRRDQARQVARLRSALYSRDPTLVNELVTARLGYIERDVGRGVAAAETSRTRRLELITLYDTAYREAYRAADQAYQHPTGREARAPPNLDGRLWIDVARDQLTTAMAGLRTQTTTAGTTLADGIRTTGAQTQAAVRTWSDSRLRPTMTENERTARTALDADALNTAITNGRAEAAANAGRDRLVGEIRFAVATHLQAQDERDEVCRARAVSLDADSMAVGRAYLQAGDPGDPLSAVAESLVSRYASENLATRPTEIRDAVHARPATDEAEARRLAQVYFPGGSASLDDRVDRLWRAFQVWHGTAEEDAINALSGGLDAHATALLNTHYELRHNQNLQWRIRDEMSGSDRNMALGLASNDAAMHARGVIADSNGWFSNDPQRALDAIRNLPPGTVDRVVSDPDTREHLTTVLGGARWVHGRGGVTDDRGERELQLLVQLNAPVSATDPADLARRRDLQARVDAIEFDRTVRVGSGGDGPGLDTLFERIRASVLAQPGTDAWSAAEVDDEVRRRVRAMENAYEGEFGSEVSGWGVSAMRTAIALNQRGTTYDLTTALIDVNRANERSTRLQRTTEGLYAADSEVNSELERGYRDALTEVRRNTTRRMEVEARMQQLMEMDGITANGRRPNARERSAYRLEAEEELARTIAAGWMTDTTAAFATRYGRRWGGGANALTEMVTDVTQFGGEREAVDRLANGGGLTSAQRVTHGVRGWGMERDLVVGALSGRTQQQLARIGAEYSTANAGENMVDRLRSETGDWTEATPDTSLERDAFDVREALRGVPLTAREEHDAATRRFTYERDVYFGGASARPSELSHEFASLQAQYDLANEQLRDYESAVARGDTAAVRRIEVGLTMANDAVSASADHYRRAVDDHVEGIAQKVAIGVALAVVAIAAIATTILTGGLAAPAWVGVATAVAASLAGTAASMAVRADMLQAAYGRNAFRNDLIVGAIDAIIAAVTAGLGDKLLRLPRLAGATAGARTLMARSIAAQRASRPLIARLGAFSVEQVVQGVPASAAGVALNRDTWRGDPARAIAGAAGMGAIMSLGMGGVMHVGMAHAPRVFGGALDVVRFLRGNSGAAMAADSVTLQSARRAVAAGNAEGASTRGSWLERWAARREYLRANPEATSFDFDLALAEGRVRAQADATAVAELRVEMRNHLVSGLSGEDAALAQHARIEVLSDAEFFARTGSESNGYAATLNVRGEPVVVIREGAPLTRLREEGLHVAQFFDPANASHLALLDERRLADYAGFSLTERIAAWNAKIDLELDVANRQLPELRAQLADPALHPDRVADLSRMVAEAEAALETLSMRRRVLADLGPAELARMRQGDLAPPAFLADEPRLFAKKNGTATTWTSGTLTFEAEADFMDGSRRSRFVTVSEAGEIREVVLQRWRNGGWELSGKVGRERGGVAEVAARIEHALSNAAEESATVTTRQFNGQTGGGQGLDDVWFRFETQTDGTLVARARLYEAKNYADTQVTSYTAIDDNYKTNVGRVRDRLQAHLDDGTWAEANMTRAQVEAAIAALDGRQVDIIIRTTSSTRVNPQDLVTIQGALNRGRKGAPVRVWHDPASIGAAAIEDAEELWLRTEAFRRRGAKDADNILFRDLATGPRGMTPESVDVAEAVVTARAQPGSPITGRVEFAPGRTHLRDSTGPLRVIVADRPVGGAAFDATARARAILDATAAIPGATGIDAGPMRVIVDYSSLTPTQARALRAALASVAVAEGRTAAAGRVVWTPPASFLP